MEMTFKTIMICNRIPDIANADKALINRFVIFPFLGTWCEDAPEDIEEQFRQRKFKLDPFFDGKIPELARALIWVCVQYYSYYANEGLPFPDIIKEYIKKHWEDNDPYLQFISERLEYAYKDKDKKEVDTEVTIGASEMYPFFKTWYKDYYPTVSPPTLAQFKSDMCMDGRLNIQPKKGLWIGIKMKNIIPDLAGAGIKI
jgi:phage/plasmid-associated DNA primase